MSTLFNQWHAQTAFYGRGQCGWLHPLAVSKMLITLEPHSIV